MDWQTFEINYWALWRVREAKVLAFVPILFHFSRWMQKQFQHIDTFLFASFFQFHSHLISPPKKRSQNDSKIIQNCVIFVVFFHNFNDKTVRSMQKLEIHGNLVYSMMIMILGAARQSNYILYVFWSDQNLKWKISSYTHFVCVCLCELIKPYVIFLFWKLTNDRPQWTFFYAIIDKNWNQWRTFNA